MSEKAPHIPVLLEHVLDVLKPKPGNVIVDCTLGLGGHSAELLQRIRPNGRLIGIDFDPANIAFARQRLEHVRWAGAGQGGGFELFHNNFAALPAVLTEAGLWEGGELEAGGHAVNGGVDSLLADIGVASTQIDDPARGFSYRRPGPLDMRMDPTRGQPASALVNRLSEKELAAAILDYGDEEDAPKIARLIVKARKLSPISTTQALTAIICEARDFTLQRAAGAKLHPAARTFQALRILVNREMANLERLLKYMPHVLKPGGIGAIISFHSGEDRRVKHAFREAHRAGIYSEISHEPLIADEAEERKNPRARSAKLRWAIRAQQSA